jgi:hypothetical protein
MTAELLLTTQLFSELNAAPPPPPKQLLATSKQLLNVEYIAPPALMGPWKPAKLFASVQFTSVFEQAPPPLFALLLVRIQFKSVP